MEGSKVFAKDFMARWKIPTASSRSFNNHELAKSYLDGVPHSIVIKADGLYVQFWRLCLLSRTGLSFTHPVSREKSNYEPLSCHAAR